MSTTESIQGIRNRGGSIRVESASRPGLFHFVSADFNFCSCEAKAFGTVETCKHQRIARVRAAKAEAEYVIERQHNSRFGGFEYLIIRKINGREEVLGFRPTRRQAEADVAEIVSGLEVA